jgi:hypothetical protein
MPVLCAFPLQIAPCDCNEPTCNTTAEFCKSFYHQSLRWTCGPQTRRPSSGHSSKKSGVADPSRSICENISCIYKRKKS